MTSWLIDFFSSHVPITKIDTATKKPFAWYIKCTRYFPSKIQTGIKSMCN